MVRIHVSERARRKAEALLRKNEQWYHTLLQSHPLGVVRIDRAGTVLDCNERFLQLAGLRREEIIGRNGAAIGLPGIASALPKALGGELAIAEGEFAAPGIPAVLLRIAYNPVNSENLSPSDIIATAEDVTARRSAEEESKTANERMKAIFGAIKEPIVIHPCSPKHAHDTFSDVNDIACMRYGYTRDEFLRLSVRDILRQDPNQKSQAIERLKKIIARGHMVFETVHVTKSGEEFPVEVSASVMDLAGEKSILAVIRDITDRQAALEEKSRLESHLLQAQKTEAVGRLAGGVAHDFNNMLSVILGYCDLAMFQVTLDHPLHRNLVEIRKAAKHSADLTQQLLAFARQQAIMPKVLEPNEAIGGLIGMLRRLIGEEIILEWHPAVEAWPIKLDPSQINQILANLCINARDAIAGDGQIRIGIENVTLDERGCADIANAYPGDFVVLSVADNGQGMEKETLDFIFEPFFTTKGQGEGTGLGLATVYGIVKQNKGFITVASEPGRGTTFKNYLPRFCGANLMASGSGPSSPAEVAGGRETILLVEDERAILEVVTEILHRQGYRVLAAATPAKAISLATRSKTIHLLMTDIIMPGMNGRKLARQLQKIHPGLRCLFMSGYTADVIATHEIEQDGMIFLQKPFQQDDLLATLRNIFRKN